MNTPSQCLRGFTLIELLAVLTVVAVVVAIGAPPLGDWLARQRLSAELQVLLRDLQQARHEAVLTNRPVVLCPATAQRDCNASGDWGRGWITFFNDDNDQPPRRDAAEPLIGSYRIAPQVAINANRRAFQFRGDLRRATNGTLVACDRGGRATLRVLVVSYTGRPRIVPSGQHASSVSC